MKKHPLLLSLFLFTGLASVSYAQTTPSATATSTAKSSSGYCMMKDGKMTMVKNGKQMPMAKDMTMSDGSMCMTDGTCKTKDGIAMKMKEGECMMMNGKITMRPGSTKRPTMKGTDKMGDMKM